MIQKFVVVPAVPKETGSTRIGTRFYCQTGPIEFNIYDNEEKRRLQVFYSGRIDAEDECERLNRNHLEGAIAEHDKGTPLPTYNKW